MKKSFISMVVLFVVFGLMSFSFAEEKISAVEEYINKINLENLEKYSVKIFSTGQAGIGFCTGTVLSNEEDKSTVLTCKHCLQADEEFLVEGNKVEKIITTTGEDLAYLIVEGKLKDKQAASLGVYNESVGAVVRMYGQPGLATIHAEYGEVLMYTKNYGFAKLDVIGGCSGSGLFNDNDELIGVVWGAFTEGGVGGGFFSEPTGGIKIGLFEPLDDVRKFLEQIKE